MIQRLKPQTTPAAADLTALFEVEELEQRLENEGWDIHVGPGGVVVDYPYDIPV
ncbi:hypothetical protein [Hymenobacter algoricola]|uniref:Uncharacterized protein n=1 Tax=Hymenobacter algoricola TaxID=486267 RepID=A0ABP7N0P5_9BACT